MIPRTARAASWVGNINANWNTAANWGGTLPTLAGDAFVFGAAGTAGTTLNNDITGQAITSLTFSAGAPAWIIGGNAVTLSGNVTNSSTSLQTVNFNIATTGVRTFSLTTGGGNIAVGGQISGTGGGVTLSGAGSLTLSGNNSYTGNTSIGTGATLNLSHAAAIGTGTLVASGTAILDNTSGTAITLANNNNVNLSGGSLTFTGTNNLSLGSGTVTISSSNRTITTTAGTLTIGNLDASGTSATTRAFTKAGSGTLIISGAAGANFQGGTTLSGGTLGVSNNTALGTGGITFSASTIFQAVGNDVTLANTGTFSSFTISGTQSLTFTGKLTGSSGGSRTLTNSVGTGKTLTLGAVDITNDTSGTTRTFTLAGTGNTIISGIIAPGDTTGTTNRAFTVSNTGLTVLTAANTYAGTTTISAGATLQLGNGGSTGSIDSTSGITNNGTLVFNRSDSSLTISVVISGAGAVTQSGAGTTILTATNTYTGLTTINAGGTLQLGNGGGAGNIADSSGVVNNGTLVFNRSGSPVFSTAISGSGAVNVIGPGTVVLSLTNSYTGQTTINVGSTLQLGSGAGGGTTGNISDSSGVVNNGTLIFNRSNSPLFSAAISGSGAVSYIGTGTVILSVTNSYTGQTTINAGSTLQLGSGTGGGSAGNISDSSGVVNNGTLIFNRSNSPTFSTAISGTGAVSQIGGGTVTLTDTNTYTGATTISAGTLQLGSGGTAGSIDNTSGITNDATLAFNRSNNFIVGAAISGGGVVTQLGTGFTSLSGANSYSGGTNINAGGLIFLNTGAKSAGGTTTVAAGTVLGLGVAASGSFFTVADVDSLFTNTMTNVSIDAAAIVGIDTTAGDFTYSSSVGSTTRGLAKLGAGMLTLTGSSAFSGQTDVYAGSLRISHANALGTTAGVTTVNDAATLELSFASDTTIAEDITFTGTGGGGLGAVRNVSGNNTLSGLLRVGTASTSTSPRLIAADAGTTLTLSGTIRTGATADGTRTLFLGGAGNILVSGVITNGTPTTRVTAFTKQDDGTVTLSNANTYSGATNINGGTLLVTNTTGSATGTGGVTTAASTILGGSGIIAPTGTNGVIIGGNVAPGVSDTDNGVGTLRFTPVDGDVIFQAGSSVAFQLLADGISDKIIFNASGDGVVDFSAMTHGSLGVAFVGGYTPQLGHSFDLLDWTAVSGAGINGLSDSLLNLSTAGFDSSWIWDTSLFASSGVISIALVPEPSRMLLLACGLAALHLRRRR